jgi:Cell division protein CrgA
VSKPRSATAHPASQGSSISVVRTGLAALLTVAGLAYALYYIFAVLEDGTPKVIADLGDWNHLIGWGVMFVGLMLFAHERTPLGRGRGVVVGMLGCFLIGDLGSYNLLIGIGFMATGFVYATKWE